MTQENNKLLSTFKEFGIARELKTKYEPFFFYVPERLHNITIITHSEIGCGFGVDINCVPSFFYFL